MPNSKKGNSLRRLDDTGITGAIGKLTEEETVVSSPLVQDIPLGQIVVGDVNVRVIDEEDPELTQLAQSIEENGLLQPVRVVREEDHYRLIAGERRYRAVKSLGWDSIPAMLSEAEGVQQTVEMLIENVQRKDLEPWEEVEGYRRLLQAGLSLGQVSKRIGKSKGELSLKLKLMSRADLRAALKSREIPSWSMARAVNPLLDADANEYVEGSVAEALDYIRRAKPTVPQMVEWVRDRLHPPEPGTAEEAPKRAPAGLLKREEDHFRDLRLRQIPKLSRLERGVLRDLLQDEIAYLDQLDAEESPPDSGPS